MGRSVSYLSHARHVNYFQWPTWQPIDDDDEPYGEEEYFDSDEVIKDIGYTITDIFHDYKSVDRWDDRETHIILDGYDTEIGLSEYCGLATLSIRVKDDDNWLEEEEEKVRVETAEKWIDENWPEIGKYWNMHRKVGTFSNGEGVYEKINKTN